MDNSTGKGMDPGSLDLEGRMRQLILQNGPVERQVPAPPGTGQTRPQNSQNLNLSRSSPRPNQRQRQQATRDGQSLLQQPASQYAAGSPRPDWHLGHNHVPDYHQPRSQVQYNGTTSRNAANGHEANVHVPSTTTVQHLGRRMHQPHQSPSGQPQHNPRSRQLYNSNTGTYGHVDNRANLRKQIQHLDLVAANEVALAQISQDESQATQDLRITLENLCRQAVASYESIRSPGFTSSNIALRNFGSLATGFATKGSDMDLVLLSPQSVPDPSSPESDIPRIIEAALLNAGYGARLLTKTRVPIIKFCELPSLDVLTRLREERRKWDENLSQGSPQNATKKADKQNTMSNTTEPSNILKSTTNSTAGTRDTTQDDAEDAATSADTKLSAVSSHLERDDPSLLEKPDHERIRLYKLAMREEWYDTSERRIITDFISAIERGLDKKTQDLFRLRLGELPNILKRYRPPTEKHLDIPKHGVGIQCDINFSNMLALHNSALLRCYSICDPRVQRLVLFIKVWAKKRKINSAYESTLSSYGYVLMVLHYLVNVTSPPVLPNLQHFPLIREDRESSKITEQDGFNVQFYRNESNLRLLADQCRLTQNQEPLGSLIQGFFQYYGTDGYRNFHWMRDVLSLRTPGGIISKQSKGWIAAKTEIVDAGPGPKNTKDIRQRYLVAIEDPFEIHHNVGRTVSHEGIVSIRDEFRRAHRLIQTIGTPRGLTEDLMVEAEDRGNLQYRYFGPRPRKYVNKKPNTAMQNSSGNGTVPKDTPKA